MSVLEEEEIDRLHQFWTIANIYEFCDAGDYAAFERETFRFIDMLRAYDGCPETAGSTYNEAKRSATISAQAIYAQTLFDTENKTVALDAAFKAYCDTMTEKFFSRFIQYRWNQVQEYRKKTSVISQVHYRDYLDALDVASYVEYSPPVAA